MFYVDGLAAGTARQVGRFGLVNKEPLRIGAKPDPYSSFHGMIDEVRIYRRVLDTGEVKELATGLRPETVAAPDETTQSPPPSIRTTVVTPVRENQILRDAEWPQWLGPDRNGRSGESGLLKRWPEGGPNLLWFVEGLGEGYSTVAISGGLIYATGTIGRQEVVFALDLGGHLRWQRPYGEAWNGRYPEARRPQRSTKVASTSPAASDASRADAQVARKCGPSTPPRNSARNIILGNRRIAARGRRPRDLHTLWHRGDLRRPRQKTGRTAWASRGLGEESGYCSPIGIAVKGRRLFVTMLNKSIAGVDADTGEILWRLMYAEYQRSHAWNKSQLARLRRRQFLYFQRL